MKNNRLVVETEAVIFCKIEDHRNVIKNLVFFHTAILYCYYFTHYFTYITSVDSLDWKDYGVDSIIKTVAGHKHLGSGRLFCVIVGIDLQGLLPSGS